MVKEEEILSIKNKGLPSNAEGRTGRDQAQWPSIPVHKW